MDDRKVGAAMTGIAAMLLGTVIPAPVPAHAARRHTMEDDDKTSQRRQPLCKAKRKAEIVRVIVNAGSDGVRASMIAAAIDMDVHNIRKDLNELVAQGRITRHGTPAIYRRKQET